MKVRFTASASEQLLRFVQRVREENPGAAIRFATRVKRVLRRLGPHPLSGKKVPEFPDHPYREVVVTPLRFFYKVEGKTVWVVAVWHGAQQVDPPANR